MSKTLNEKIVILLFIIINFYYFKYFTINYEFYNGTNSFFEFPLNFDFIKLTLPLLESKFLILKEVFEKGGTYGEEVYFERKISQIGITYIYIFFINLFSIFTKNILLISFIINNLSIIIGYYYYKKILTEIMHIYSMKMNILFFFNPILIWYSQGLNKDIFLITLFIPLIYFFYKRNHVKIFILGLIIALIRFPYAFVIPIIYCLIYFKNKYLVMFIVYFFSSLYAGYLGTYEYGSRNESVSTFLESKNSRFGISVTVAQLNESYMIGNILMNPIRLVQLIYDQLRTIVIITDGRLNLYHLLNAPITIYFIYNSLTIVKLFKKRFFYYKNLNIILYFIFSMIIVCLMSPFIHARYASVIIYPLFIAILYYNMHKKIGRKL